MLTTTKDTSEKTQVSALNAFFLIWVITITIVMAGVVIWGFLPELL